PAQPDHAKVVRDHGKPRHGHGDPVLPVLHAQGFPARRVSASLSMGRPRNSIHASPPKERNATYSNMIKDQCTERMANMTAQATIAASAYATVTRAWPRRRAHAW